MQSSRPDFRYRYEPSGLVHHPGLALPRKAARQVHWFEGAPMSESFAAFTRGDDRRQVRQQVGRG